MRAGRPKAELVLSDAARAQLESFARSRSLPAAIFPDAARRVNNQPTNKATMAVKICGKNGVSSGGIIGEFGFLLRVAESSVS